MQNSSLERISVSHDGSEEDGFSGDPGITSDECYLTFESFASNLVTPDYTFLTGIYLRDRLEGPATLVSASSGGSQSNTFIGSPVISPDRHYVDFYSGGSNLVETTLTTPTMSLKEEKTLLVSGSSHGTQGDLGSG